MYFSQYFIYIILKLDIGMHHLFLYNQLKCLFHYLLLLPELVFVFTSLNKASVSISEISLLFALIKYLIYEIASDSYLLFFSTYKNV